ncbi:hypothetical protein DIC66_19715 [Rhodoferax lacus]|uniref:Uncharacterized protein n=1 Tax=Rhodoferax lacus TaxID=2184758 RepID=A0A3E1R7C0_9BURK|nr:hypothetical protein [Rhodoferax lacus]RFO95143.1 hypothetical protein DIC66_19715 [Rhodoferax lacus]
MSNDIFPGFPTAAQAPSIEIEQAQQPLDKRIVGEQQRIGVCRYLHRFGWLTSRMVAALVFDHAAQAWPLARRCLKSMLEDGLVIKRALPQGGTEVYLLSAKGARFLNEFEGLDASSGQGLALGNPVHRACSNWYLIKAILAGWDVITEHEISTDRCPVRVLDGKQVDGIMLGEGEAIVLECENAWKATKARNSIVSFCSRHLDQERLTMITPDYPIRQLTLVCTNQDALRHMVASYHQAFRELRITEGQLQMVNVSLLPISRSLVPGEQLDTNLWFDEMLPLL